MGKDNIPFHTIIFPSCLLGSGYNWTMLSSISTTDYLNYEGGKFSKSRNLGVFGTDAQESGIPAEVWRYYLLSNRPETADSNFSWDDLMGKTNSELLANLGNFVNRALSFCKANLGSKVPSAVLSDADEKFIANVNKELKEYISSLDKIYLKDGLKIAMGISKLGNQYMQGTLS
jgi:methionyl-tRNA synthetase